MTELKCPYCGKKLEKHYWDDLDCYACPNLTCDGYYMTATQDMWQELIHTRKALDILVDALKEIDDSFESIMAKALEQITALEQKDVK